MAAQPPPPDRALIWRRHDWSETSRVVTMVSRRLGKVTALAKGAHRPKGPFLGVLDQLNLVEPRFARRRSEAMRLLHGVVLLHEPRGLREPLRFVAASHLVEMFDVAFTPDRADPELFDLLAGALRILERCPATGLRAVLAGAEMKFLEALGLLPDLEGCSDCGVTGGPLYVASSGQGLRCKAHRTRAAPALATADLRWLRALQRTPGRHWADLPPPGGQAVSALGVWVAAAVERGPRLRSRAFSAKPARSSGAARR